MSLQLVLLSVSVAVVSSPFVQNREFHGSSLRLQYSMYMYMYIAKVLTTGHHIFYYYYKYTCTICTSLHNNRGNERHKDKTKKRKDNKGVVGAAELCWSGAVHSSDHSGLGINMNCAGQGGIQMGLCSRHENYVVIHELSLYP